MRLLQAFHHTIATSKFTLPVVVLLSAVVWILLDGENIQTLTFTEDYGLWQLMPESVSTGALSAVAAFVVSIISVYFMTELNNTFVLLRISSRMLGSLLAVLLMVSVFLHTLHPAHVVLLLMLLSYYPLWASYQQHGSMAYVFVAYMLVSMASLVFPKLLLIVPFYWVAQIMLRSLNPRTLAASVIGVVVPYWIAFSFVYVNDCLTEALSCIIKSFEFSLPDYSCWTLQQALITLFVFILSAVGIVDFYMHGNHDKTRTRVYLNVVVVLSVAAFMLLVWETSHFIVLFPLALINTSILAGHHLAQSNSRFNNIYLLVVLVLAVALIVLEVLL